MANTQVLDEERDLLFGIDNACPNWRGLRMKERAFVIDLFRLRSTPHKPTEKQMVWLRAIHARVTAPGCSGAPMTKAQEERLVQAVEGISLGLNSIAKCMEERLGKDFPPEKERQDAEVFKQGEQAGAEGAAPGRFENRYSEAQKAASQSA